MAARTGKFDDLVRSETLYPAELTAHSWQLHYLTLVTLLHSTSDSTEGFGTSCKQYHLARRNLKPALSRPCQSKLHFFKWVGTESPIVVGLWPIQRFLMSSLGTFREAAYQGSGGRHPIPFPADLSSFSSECCRRPIFRPCYASAACHSGSRIASHSYP